MKKSDNIYIDALRFGVQNMSTGTSLNELKTHLIDIGWTIDNTFHNFDYWFFTNFFYDNAYTTLKNGNSSQVYQVLYDSQAWADIKCPMSSSAYETFLDFEKLNQAKIDTKKAQRLATIAIWISAGLALIQIVLQVISMAK